MRGKRIRVLGGISSSRNRWGDGFGVGAVRSASGGTAVAVNVEEKFLFVLFNYLIIDDVF